MISDPVVLAPDDPQPNPLELMSDPSFSHLPVVDADDQILGIVSIYDLYTAVKKQLEEDVRQREFFILDTGHGAGA